MSGRFVAILAVVLTLSAGTVYAANDTPQSPAEHILIPPNAWLPDNSYVSGPGAWTFTKIFDWELWPLIQYVFIREIPNTEAAKKDCLESIMQGGISLCLEDPHSHYVPAREVKESTEKLIGRFAGVGLALQMFGNSVNITEVMEDSPAEKSGKFRPGDAIIEVDGENIAKMSLIEVVKKIKGLPDSTVTLRVSRLGIKRPPVTLKRAEIITKSVRSEVIDGHTILIKIFHFTPDTYAQFLYAIKPYVAVNTADGSMAGFSKDFVVDLRGNPGGLLNIVAEMGHLFAEKPTDVLVTIKTRTEEQPITAGQFFPLTPLTPSRLGILRGMHFVVLVDHYSASAAEIFAGMMQDFKVAKIVGTNTFGKGSVQQVITLDSGGQFILTFAEYLVGNGKVKVNGIGIKPDVMVGNAITIGNDDDNITTMKRPPKKPKLVDLKKDKQLRAALKVLKEQKQ